MGETYTKEQNLVLRTLSSISPDMRRAREKDPEIFLEMVAIELSVRTGEAWDTKKVLAVLLPILFATGDKILFEEG